MIYCRVGRKENKPGEFRVIDEWVAITLPMSVNTLVSLFLCLVDGIQVVPLDKGA